jgi:hypothetical protein
VWSITRSTSVAEEQKALERQLETSARVDGIELVNPATCAVSINGLAVATAPTNCGTQDGGAMCDG